MSFRSNDKKLRFPGVILAEQDIEEILKRAVQSKILDFSGANLSREQPLFIADIISSNRLLSFVHVDLSATQITTKGFESIVTAALELHSLENFIAKDNNLSKDVGLVLSKLVGARGALKLLDLSNNQLGDIGIASIAGIFGMVPSSPNGSNQSLNNATMSMFSLTILEISNNNFGDAGVSALCRGLTQSLKQSGSLSLKILRMNNNKMGDKAALCLAQLINSKPNPSYSSLNLEELSLNDNAALTHKGINALLGNTSEGVMSPLKKLFVSRCQPNLTVLQQLAVNLRSGRCRLEQCGVEFTESVCTEVIRESASKFNKMENSYSGYATLSTVMKQLSDAITATVTTSKSVIKRIDLGALPRIAFTSCTHAARNKLVAQYQDTLKALDSMNTRSDVYGLQYIGHIKSWVGDGVYDSRPHFAIRPLLSVQDLEATAEALSAEILNKNSGSNHLVTTSSTSVVTSSSSSSSVTTSTNGGSAALAAAVALKESMERIMPTGDGGAKSSFLNTLQTQLHSPVSAHGAISQLTSSTEGVSSGAQVKPATNITQFSDTVPNSTNYSHHSIVVDSGPGITRSGSNSAHSSPVAPQQAKKVFSQQDLLAAPVMPVKTSPKTHNKSNGNILGPPLLSSKTSFAHSINPSNVASPNQRRFMEHLSAGGNKKEGVAAPVISKPLAGLHNVKSNHTSQPVLSIAVPVAAVRGSHDQLTSNESETTHQLVEKEEQYLLLRKDRSDALHSLANEIQLLMESSPTRENETHGFTLSTNSEGVGTDLLLGEELSFEEEDGDKLSQLGELNKLGRLAGGGNGTGHTQYSTPQHGVHASSSGQYNTSNTSEHTHTASHHTTNTTNNRHIDSYFGMSSTNSSPGHSVGGGGGGHMHHGTDGSSAFHTAPQHVHPPQQQQFPPPVQVQEQHPRHLSPPSTDRGSESSLYADQPLSAFPVRNRQPLNNQQQQQQTNSYLSTDSTTMHSTSHAKETVEFKQLTSKMTDDVAALSVLNNSTQQYLSLLVAQVKSMEIRQSTSEGAILARLTTIESRLDRLEVAQRDAAIVRSETQSEASAGVLSANTVHAAEFATLQGTVESLAAAVARTNKLLVQQQQASRVNSEEAAEVHKSLGQRIMNGITGRSVSPVEGTPGGVPATPQSTSNGPSVTELTTRLEQLERSLLREKESSFASMNQLLQMQKEQHEQWRHEKQAHRHELFQILNQNQQLQMENELFTQQQQSNQQQIQLDQDFDDRQLQQHQQFMETMEDSNQLAQSALRERRWDPVNSQQSGGGRRALSFLEVQDLATDDQSMQYEEQTDSRQRSSSAPRQRENNNQQSRHQSGSNSPRQSVDHVRQTQHHRGNSKSSVGDHHAPSRKMAIAEYLPEDYQSSPDYHPLDGPKYSDDPATLNPPLHKHQTHHGGGGLRVKPAAAGYLRSIKAVPALPSLPMLPAESPAPMERRHDPSDHQFRTNDRHEEDRLDERPQPSRSTSATRQRPAASSNSLNRSVDSDAGRDFQAVMPEYRYETLQPGGGNRAQPVSSESTGSKSVNDIQSTAAPPARVNAGGRYSTGPPTIQSAEYGQPPPLPPTSSFKPAFMVPTSSHQIKLWAKGR